MNFRDGTYAVIAVGSAVGAYVVAHIIGTMFSTFVEQVTEVMNRWP